MNRSLPTRDRGSGSAPARRASRHLGALPGALGLVGRVAAPATTIGPCCATFGPRSTGGRCLDEWAKAAINAHAGGIGADGKGTASASAFQRIKHGGFARLLRETLCASTASENEAL